MPAFGRGKTESILAPVDIRALQVAQLDAADAIGAQEQDHSVIAFAGSARSINTLEQATNLIGIDDPRDSRQLERTHGRHDR